VKSSLLAGCLLALVGAATDLHAEVNPYKDGTPGVSGYRSEVLAEVMIQEDKFLRLAEAIPADKYPWRPAPDVRSFAEVFLHVSAANYNLYKLVGATAVSTVLVTCLNASEAGSINSKWPACGISSNWTDSPAFFFCMT
jgi:hypothetical protein